MLERVNISIREFSFDWVKLTENYYKIPCGGLGVAQVLEAG